MRSLVNKCFKYNYIRFRLYKFYQWVNEKTIMQYNCIFPFALSVLIEVMRSIVQTTESVELQSTIREGGTATTTTETGKVGRGWQLLGVGESALGVEGLSLRQWGFLVVVLLHLPLPGRRDLTHPHLRRRSSLRLIQKDITSSNSVGVSELQFYRKYNVLQLFPFIW